VLLLTPDGGADAWYSIVAVPEPSWPVLATLSLAAVALAAGRPPRG
jgi:hypothetical protein